MQLPHDFEIELKSNIGVEEFQNFKFSFDDPVPVSIRVNVNKNKDILSHSKTPWCPAGYYLNERPVFTLDPAFHTGSYYVQEASSMFIWHIMEHFLADKRNVRILDLCASPGGKSTLIAAFLNNNGLLVSNELIKSRAYVLKYNVSKEGHSNVIVTNNDPKDFSQITEYFDLILVDAPCSGEGMFRKDPNAVFEWSTENVAKCVSRQKRILADVLPALKQDGLLLYSTCTYNRYENINNVQWLTSEKNLISIPVKTNKEWNIFEICDGANFGYQFFPHKVKGEGFFISVLKKEAESESNFKRKTIMDKSLTLVDTKSRHALREWIKLENISLLFDKTGTIHAINSQIEAEAFYLYHFLRLIYCGVSVGVLNKSILIPDHSLALSYLLTHNFQTIELKKEDALHFLKKSLSYVETNQKSWILATYKENGLGFLKNLGHRINNYLPQEYRILMDINSANNLNE